MKHVIAVFGYNNTRSYDVAKIRKIAQEQHGAELLLVKESVNDTDREISDYVIDAAPENPHLAQLLGPYLAEHSLQLIGCLPFSDRGVIGAAHCAKHFQLPGDDVDSALAMLDKSAFRALERDLDIPSTLYKKPFFHKVTSYMEASALLLQKGAFFIKPTSEGNSRGCMRISTQADLTLWTAHNPGAFRKGVICEEIISNDREYSFDGVDGSYWITQKFTTTGAFRAEYQHIVPAPFDEESTDHLHGILTPLLHDLGSRGGAFHHEFFHLHDGRLASVEPNRRPAGMWIWDLAAWSFEGFDPWSRWVNRCVGKENSSLPTLHKRVYSGVRGVRAPMNGVLDKIDLKAMEAELRQRLGSSKLKLSMLKDVGSELRKEPRDNSDFVAFVALQHRSHEALCGNLAHAERIIQRHLTIRLSPLSASARAEAS